MSLFRTKSLEDMLAQAEESEKGLKRTLGAGNLVALGIGAIIGAGLFVRTAAAAGGHAGSAVTISFVVCFSCMYVLVLCLCYHGRIVCLDYWLGIDPGICAGCGNCFHCLE